jgi:N utilization substance protein B
MAVQFLYQVDVLQPEDAKKLFAHFWDLTDASAEVMKFTTELIEGVLDKATEIDAKIQAYADNWEMERIAPVDKNILRVALFEILYREDIPNNVSIDEAIELAKKFSSEESGKFINGILDRANKDVASKK